MTKILVVDDEKFNLDLLDRALSRKSYEVICVDSGEKALMYLQDEKVDLVLLDVMMPELDGFAVLKDLRTAFTPIELPIIMATAKTQSEDIARALRSGANDYITKPIDLQVAYARIETQLNLKKAEEDLVKSEERFNLAVQGTSDGIWDWNLNTNEIYYSPRWKEILGYSDTELPNNPEIWFNRIHPSDKECVIERIEDNKAGRTRNLHIEYRIKNKNGQYIWVLTRGSVLDYQNGKVHRMVGGQTNITQTKAYDFLTGLFTRTLFCEKITTTYSKVKDWGQACAIFVMSIDQYRQVRDSLDPKKEEELLIEVSRRLSSCIYPQDSLARLGGHEFAILYEDLTDRDLIHVLANKINKTIAHPFVIGDLELFLTTSIGIVFVEEVDKDPEQYLHNALLAKEEASGRGDGHHVIFEEKFHDEAVKNLRLDVEIRHGIERNEFLLHYQPIISTTTGEITGCEALVRWEHPERGFLSPFAFIDRAEKSGLIVELGTWIFKEACRQAMVWAKSDLPRLSVSINFSAKQFMQRDLETLINSTLEETGLDPHLIKIELTESTLVENLYNTISLLNKFREKGIQISLDDFGTGYSSLSYLKRLPIDVLKVDQSFVRGITEDPIDMALVKGILQIASQLGLKTIAEGVETQEHAILLKNMDCTMCQGYHFAKPLSPEAFEALVRNNGSFSF